MTANAAIDTAVRGLGYELVDVERAPRGLLRVTIDHPALPEERFITVDDCEKVTRQLQHVLEVEGLAYERLEVSSPGLDRPLKSAADFARFEGERIELTLKVPFEGRKRFRGELQTRGDDWQLLLEPAVLAPRGVSKGKPATTRRPPIGNVDVKVAERVLDFSFGEVREARLVPVIDFKGRPAAGQDAAAHEATTRKETDGGRIQ